MVACKCYINKAKRVGREIGLQFQEQRIFYYNDLFAMTVFFYAEENLTN